jgi:tetratricopeptide (TPR) repeat protein
LGRAYRQTIAQADHLYHIGRYEPALRAYQQAHGLIPSETGALIGIGWTWLQLGYFYEAESVLQSVGDYGPNRAIVQQGLDRLPRSYPLTATLSQTIGIGPGQFLSTTALLKYSHLDRTTLTAGLQYVAHPGAEGFNCAVVAYHRLAFPWAIRFDFYGLSAFNQPRYWQVVFAPSVARLINTTRLQFTLVGWDKLQVFGAQLEAEQRLPGNLRITATPTVNQAYGQLGWWLPAEAAYSPLPWLELRAGVGGGTIAYHADLAVPTLYNQPERLLNQFKIGVNIRLLERYRIKAFVAGEGYDNHVRRLLPSLTLSVMF